jgi:carboxypeptidase family protein/TonB-dependent receptor-like protein
MTNSNKKRRIWRVPASALPFGLLLFLPFALLAQNPRGALRGVVQDSSGGRIPSAKIVVQAAEFSLVREVKSNERGEFRIDDLLPGSYRVSFSAAGFATVTADARVSISSVREMIITLKPPTVRETVTLDGPGSVATQPMDTSSAVHQAVITGRDLDTIPLAARSFANIAYLAPGTEPVEPSDPTKARITAVSSGGSSGLNNELSVDGGDNSDDYIGGFLQNFSPETIEEFAVRTAQEDADTGRTTAASFVLTTKSGTNTWHGDEAFYERAAALNARFPIDNPAPDPKQPFSRQNYVGTLGGPPVKDKLWIFSYFEYVHEDASIAYSPASQAQFSALSQLAAEGLVSVGGTTVTSIPVPQNVPVPFRDYLGNVRLDWAQSTNSQWFLRASTDSYITRNALIQQGTLPSTGATSHNNYLNLVISNQHTFSPTWVGSFVLGASALHLTAARNSSLGFALAFPFSSTSSTISGRETFGDNQFITAITAFPVLRNQEKYQLRYDVSHASGRHAPRFGVNFIHEPVLSGALTASQETLVTLPQDPIFYLANPAQFTADIAAGSTTTPASDGSFSQNVQRLGLYAEDSWRVGQRLTVNYGVRYDTTFGLFTASGREQSQNPIFATLAALQIPFVSGVPHDYRKAFAPRVGIAYSPADSSKTVIRGGFGLYFNDLAQNGWVSALQAVNTAPGSCVVAFPVPDPGCIPGAAGGGAGSIIDAHYKTPYALHATAGVQHAFTPNWILSADFTLETGMHGYRRYQYQSGFTLKTPLAAVPQDPADQMNVVPNVAVFRSDNRSSYKALSLHLQGNVSHRFSLIANYTLSSAKTWGCVLGELFDYVNGVCNPLNAFAKGDYGPSGEDVTHRAVIAGTFYAPGGFQLTLLSQAESARPITLVTTADVNGLGDPADNRAVVNGVQTSLDQFRGTPYLQTDLRVSRPFTIHERWSVAPFIEFFNLFNRNNPGANYVTDISALPTPVNSPSNVTALCPTPACSVPITSGKQLLVPAGALGDFFGPGTTVGIPFAAQIGVRLTF